MSDDKNQEQQAAKSLYERVKAEMSFVWICNKCHTSNSILYVSWYAYNGLSECVECERRHAVQEPWR